MENEDKGGIKGGKLRILGAFLLMFLLGFGAGHAYPSRGESTPVLTVSPAGSDCAALFEKDTVNTAAPAVSITAASTNPESTPATAGAEKKADSGTALHAFAGSKNSNLYHTKDCQYVKRIKAENLVWFSSQQEAKAAGRQPHSCVKK